MINLSGSNHLHEDGVFCCSSSLKNRFYKVGAVLQKTAHKVAEFGKNIFNKIANCFGFHSCTDGRVSAKKNAPIKVNIQQKELQEAEDAIKKREEQVASLESATERETLALSVFQQEKDKELSDSVSRLDISLIALDDDNTVHFGEEREKLHLEEKNCLLHSYFYHLFADKKAFEDKTIIGFKNGRIVPLSSASSKEKSKAVDTCRHILRETYGPCLEIVVSTRYRLDKIKELTFGDLKRAMVGIAANVKVTDLKELFKAIKKPDQDSSGMRAKAFLKNFSKEAFESLKQTESFENLTSEQISYLLLAFRMIPTEEKTLSSLEALVGNPTQIALEANKRGDYILEHDLNLLSLFDQSKDLLLNHKELNPSTCHQLAISEYVGKSLPYHDLKMGMVFSLPDMKGDSQFYKVVDGLKYEGVIPSLIAPINQSQNAYQSDDENIHLVFRGTASGTQWFRNTDPRGIGKKTFTEKRDEIIQMVESYLKKTTEKNVVLNISGHSLGGCDAQRALTLIAKAVAESEESSPLRKLKELKLVTHNAPRPDPEVNQEFKEAVARLQDENENKLKIDLKHLRYFDKDGYQDTVHCLGQVLLGADEVMNGDGTSPENTVLKDAPFVHRELIDIQIEQACGLSIEGAYMLHGFTPFNTKLAGKTPWSFRALNLASTEEQRKEMEKVFAGSYHRIPGDKNTILGNVYSYAAYPFSGIKNLAHMAVNGIQGIILKTLLLGYRRDLRREAY